MTVYICEEYQKEYLFHLLAQGHANNTVMGVRLQTLKQTVTPRETQDSLALQLQLMQKLRPRKEEFRHYGDMIRYPSFLKEVLDFARLCALYGIASDDLPADRDNEKELRVILKEALSLPLEETYIHGHREEAVQRLSRDTMIVQTFEKEPFYEDLRKDAVRAGAQCLDLPAADKADVQLRHILSMEKEIEAVAQDICTHVRTCTVVLCDPKAQMPHAAAVFARYGIPYSWTGRSLPSRIHDIYCALARFAMDPDSEHLQEAVRTGAFSKECSPGLISYLARRYQKDELWPSPAAETYKSIMDTLKSEKDENRSWIDFQRIEAEMEQYRESIADEVEALLHPAAQEGLSEAAGLLLSAYTVLQKSPLLQYENEYELAMDLRKTLSSLLPLVKDRSDAAYVIRCLEGTGARSHAYASPAVQVTDLTHPVPKKDITYVLGADGTCYPGFTARKGLFDEEYTARIPAFPSLKDRYDRYMEQLKWVGRSADTIVYSYYTNDTSGREKLLAFAITDYAATNHISDKVQWELIESSYRYRPIHELTPGTSASLFTTDGVKVRGSISSIENWFQCHYRYFINYGLKIRRNDLPQMDAALRGTIHHAAMELLTREYRKTYPEHMNEETLRPLVSAYFDALAVTCEKDRGLLKMGEERLIRTLIKAGRFFDRCEKDSPSFEPVCAEANFNDVVFADNVVLNGTIDRIDHSLEHSLYRIIDYKSSTNDLNEKQVRSGLKLQLLTYMLAALEEPEIAKILAGAEPAGAYYYMIKEDMVSDDKKTAAVSRNKRTHEGEAVEWKYRKYEDDPMSRYVEKQRFLDAHSVNGWSFAEDITVLDAGGNLKNASYRYSLDAVRDCLEDVYAYFHDTLLSEEGIALKPVKYGMDGPCKHCDYRPVCRFHGELEEPQEHSEAELKEGKYEN